MEDLVYNLRVSLPNFQEFYDDMGYYDKKEFDRIVHQFYEDSYNEGYSYDDA